MGPSEKAFNQVKSILGKLDRSIDLLREQRTAPPPVAAAVLPIRAEAPKPAPVVVPTPPAPYRSSSGFGRATPIPPSHN